MMGVMTKNDSEDALFEHFFGSFPVQETKHTDAPLKESDWVHFGEVSVNRVTGEVQLPDEGELSEVARSFWLAVRNSEFGQPNLDRS